MALKSWGQNGNGFCCMLQRVTAVVIPFPYDEKQSMQGSERLLGYQVQPAWFRKVTPELLGSFNQNWP